MQTRIKLVIAAVLAIFLTSVDIAHAVTLQPGDIIIGANVGASPSANWGLLEIDPTTGDRTIITDATHASGPALNAPTAVSIDSDGSLLVTFDNQTAGHGVLYRVDPVTGNRTIVSSADGNSGPTSTYVGARPFGSDILVSGGPIVSVDPATGARTLVSGTGQGTGPAFNSAGFVVSGSDLIVADQSANSILSIDTITGNRSVVSSSAVGSGPSLSEPVAVQFGAPGTVLVDTWPLTATIFSVDLATGNRTVVASSTVGTGPSIGAFPGDFGVAANGTIYISHSSGMLSQSPVLAVDPSTGNRTIVSDATHGSGPLFDPTSALAIVPAPEPASLVLLAIGGAGLAIMARRRTRAAYLPSKVKNALLVAGLFAALATSSQVVQAVTLQPGDIVVTTAFTKNDLGLMIVDPVTGNRTIFSDNTHGTGPNFTSPSGITLLPNGDLLVGDGSPFTSLGQSRLIEVDPTTGNRTIISGSGVGSGPAFQRVIGGLSNGNSIVAVDQQNLGALLNVDPTTGNRTIISGNGVGSGPVFSPGGSVVLRTNAIVAESQANLLLSIDLTTGNRSVLSGPGVGTGPSFNLINDVILGGANNLIADDASAIYSVDPITGNRTIISSATVGSGPIWNSLDPWGITSKADGTIVMAAIFSGALYTIDPVTGNRTILSDSTHGTGASFGTVYDPVVIPNVPEPSSIALLAIGAIGLAGLGQRRIIIDKLVILLAALLGTFGFSSQRALAVTLQPGDIVVSGQIGATADNDFGLVLVDPATGDRTVISDSTLGAGPNFGAPEDISLQSDRNILVADQKTGIVRVDPATGTRTVISANGGPGSGPKFGSIYDAVEVGNQILVTDLNNVIWDVDPASGNRFVLKEDFVLNGPVGFLPIGSSWYVTNYFSQHLAYYSPQTNGSLISQLSAGASGIARDLSGSLVVANSLTNELATISLPSAGPAQIFSGPSLGAGAALNGPTGVGVGPNGTVYVDNSGANSVLAVDEITGNRVILSDAAHGVGPGITSPQGLLVVPESSSVAMLLIGAIVAAFTIRRNDWRGAI